MTEQAHCIVANEALAKALAHLQDIVRTVTTIPILAHVAVETGDSEILVRASNLDREMEARLPAQVVKPGAAALPGEMLLALGKRLSKGGQCELTLVDGHAHLVSGSSKYDLRTLPIEDFLARQSASEPVEFPESASELRAMLKAVLYATEPAKSDRRYLQGVNLRPLDDKLIAVATDIVRLAVRSCTLPRGAAEMPPITVPAEAADAIVGLLRDIENDVELAVSPQLIELRLQNLRFASLLVGGTFPDYRRAMPPINDVDAKFRVRTLAEAIARVDVVRFGHADKRAPILRFTISDGAICLEAGTAGGARAIETVEAQTSGRSIRDAHRAAQRSRAWRAAERSGETTCSRPTSGRARPT